MATHTNFLFALLLLLCSSCVSTATAKVKPTPYDPVHLNRSSFPVGFVFGTAGSAYQYEGAAFEGGKGLSIWDNFTHQHPEKIADRSNGDAADNSYHRYKEDVALMKQMNLDAYRFSVSWPRILPNGKLSGGVNREGVKYYNNLINELLANGIQPYVTLFHLDTPQSLENEYGGFLSPRIVRDFKDFAEVCFREFGDRVKHWITLNEPSNYCKDGYATGSLAPGRCSDWQKLNCTGGNSATEPYLVGHHQLLAHAAAGRLYKRKYQKIQKGQIGITLSSVWTIPYSHKQKDKDAAERAFDFSFGWFIGPITYGRYPETMSRIVGNRLPKFTNLESAALKASYDFIGINYYTTYYAADNPQNGAVNVSATTDSHTQYLTSRNGVPIGGRAGSDWLYVYPKGFKDMLVYVKKKYNNPIIYITENGVSEKNVPKLPLKKALSDPKRIEYHYQHLFFLRAAIKEGVRVKGYFAWSLLDNFEWNVGYTVRFGINYVDYNDGLKRYPKDSARWFKKFLQK